MPIENFYPFFAILVGNNFYIHFVLQISAIRFDLVYNFKDLFVNSEFVYLFVCDCCSLDV